MGAKIISLPGLVDVHAHLREPGGEQKEDFESGTKAAVAGGYTQILDMPNNIPPTTDEKALLNKIRRAKGRIWCDLGFNFGGTRESTSSFSKIQSKAFGLKIYMNQTTGTLLVENDEDREKIFRAWTSRLPIMVHAEGEMIKVAIALARKYQRKLHICHITADQIEPVQKAKRNGVDITSEVCPHHLFLTKEDVKRLGSLGIMKPPLLSESDQKKLWQNIDKIDMIATDHAPHTLEEKHDHSSSKYGIPGLETALPLMLAAVNRGWMNLERLIEMMSTNPRRIFHLPEQPNTYMEVDITKKYKISKKGLFTKCGWTPFEGMKAGGKVTKVVIREKTVFLNEKFINKPEGQVIYPNIG